MPRRWRRLFSALIVLGLCLSAYRANGQRPPSKVLVLQLKPRAVSAAKAKLAASLVRDTVAGLRRFTLAPAPALGLRPMLLALGCRTLDMSCLAKIAKQLDAGRVVFGELARTATGHLIRIKVFDTASKRVIRAIDHEAADAEGDAGFEQAVRDAAAAALGEPLRLRVSGNVDGAQVIVNGQPAGKTPLVIGDKHLHIGSNSVLIRHKGYRDHAAKVVVRPGKVQRLHAVLRLAPAGPKLVKPPPPPKPPPKNVAQGTPFYKKWWFWTIVGVAVGGGAAAAALSARGGAPTGVGVEF